MNYSNKLKFTALLIFVFMAGCTSVKRLPAPEQVGALGEIPGIPLARFWGDAELSDQDERIELLRKQLKNSNHQKNDPIHILALSGGGQNGAFGAGLLTGWSASKKRPSFMVVTGISTGSLMAPFAFLGPEYDYAIKALYTNFSTKDVIDNEYFGLISGDAISDTTPLREKIEFYFTPKAMKKVAEEYKKGRRLLIGTTYLDAQRPVIWDIGAIAASNHPDAYNLIINILIASASIPGAFPPVYFTAEYNGQIYDEMHVDGGVTRQIFVAPSSFNIGKSLRDVGLNGQANIYLIRNTRLIPDIKFVKPQTFSILAQSLGTLLRSQGLGDMHMIYMDAMLEKFKYYEAHIPDDFKAIPKESFDRSYMNILYSQTYKQSVKGYPWIKTPPNFPQELLVSKQEAE